MVREVTGWSLLAVGMYLSLRYYWPDLRFGEHIGDWLQWLRKWAACTFEAITDVASRLSRAADRAVDRIIGYKRPINIRASGVTMGRVQMRGSAAVAHPSGLEVIPSLWAAVDGVRRQ
jgi:hypothetical protein